MKLSKLTLSDRKATPVHVNLDHVLSIQSQGKGSKITLATLGDDSRPVFLLVTESVDDILTALGSQGPPNGEQKGPPQE